MPVEEIGCSTVRVFHEHYKIGNIGIIANFVFPYICSFLPHDVSKCDIRYQWVQADYISRLKTLLVLFISNGTAKTKLAIFGILVFHRVCAKPSWARAVWPLLITAFFEALPTPTKQKIFILNKSKGFLTCEIVNDTYMYSFQSWTFSGKYFFCHGVERTTRILIYVGKLTEPK